MARSKASQTTGGVVVIDEPTEASAVSTEEPLEPFTGFVEDTSDTNMIPINVDEQKRMQSDMEDVAIMPRQTIMRTRISGDWYNFVKGKEVLVPRHVADWLREKGIL